MVSAFLSAALASPAAAQQWNDAAARALVARAIAVRQEARTDPMLRDYRARAHGFVFFLGQLGEALIEPPRLVKSDELVLEVYWKQPGLSKQRIIGWRDRTDLPTDIQYHRDHLGIVQNNFADRIRLGHGDEVRDVPHPLAPNGPELYDFAILDSATLRLPERIVHVYEVAVRPKQFEQPRVIGSLYVDVTTAELVVFRFSFTRVAYLDPTLEDISIVLENALWNGRWWLPRRQEIEIRRRTAWLDLPARGIIRGRWDIRDYQFNLEPPDSVFIGPEIAIAPDSVRSAFVWPQPLEAAIRQHAGPVTTFDLEHVRVEIQELAGRQVVSGLAAERPGVRAVSDLLRYNRVEGAAVGAGWVVRPRGGATAVRLLGSYGFGDRRAKGMLAFEYGQPAAVELVVERAVVDVGDERVIAPALNSILAQEVGRDYGDYVLRDRAHLTLRQRVGARGGITVQGGVERTQDAAVVTAPAHGSFRPNPPLGSGVFGVGRLTVERRHSALTVQGGVAASLQIEGGIGDTSRYVRMHAAARVQVPVASSDVVLRGWGGVGSAALPPHRSFVLGGRGTLVTEPFRAWGGRHAAFGMLEWRARAPVPAIPLGPLLSTGRHVVVAPYVAAGWAGGDMAGVPWRATSGVRPTVGVGLEWFHRLLRVDLGVNVDGDVGWTVDIGRDLWGIL